MEKEEPIKTIEYRGISAPIYADDNGQQFYTILDGEEIGFGTFNINYEADLEYLIDNKLDYICGFKDFPGARLEYFFNGYCDRDIRLTYRQKRILKVFLLDQDTKLSDAGLEKIKAESVKILTKISKTSHKKVV